MKGKFSLINKDVNFVLEEFLTIHLQPFWEGGGKHHDLFLMGGFEENILNVRAKFWNAHDLVALINNKILALF